MFEMFDEIFWQVGNENNIKVWYEIFDSELMNEVDKRIAKSLGLNINGMDECDIVDVLCDNCEEYCEWYNEMSEDL